MLASCVFMPFIYSVCLAVSLMLVCVVTAVFKSIFFSSHRGSVTDVSVVEILAPCMIFIVIRPAYRTDTACACVCVCLVCV